MNNINLGLIGCGAWGKNYLRTAENIPEINFKYIASSKSNLSADLENKNIDGIVIATPPDTHIRIANKLINKYPLIIEKPLCLDSKQARLFCQQVKTSDNFVLVNHIHLYSIAFRKLKAELSNYGEIKTINTIAGNYGPFRTDTPPLWDWAAHDIAMCIYLLDQVPIDLTAEIIDREKVNGCMAENIKINLKFPNNITANIFIGNLMDTKVRKFSVDCQYGELVYDGLAKHNFKLPLDILLTEFSDLIRNKETFMSPGLSLEIAVSTVEILNLISVFLTKSKSKDKVRSI